MESINLFRKITILCLVLPSAFPEIDPDDKVIVTSTGPVVQTRIVWDHSSTSRVFAHIPYAKSPEYDLRFKKTVPVEPWTDLSYHDSQLRMGYRFYQMEGCLQQPSKDYLWIPYQHVSYQKENCLRLDVWVPANATNDSKKACMIWIHSGDFSAGGNTWTQDRPSELVSTGDVIVVQINYRLGILGFLSTETEEVPGNMGLYDILEAIKWVKSNIRYFGGDSDNITLFGHGAGGIAVGLMCVSPMAKGLFKRAILMGGSPYLTNDGRRKNVELGQKVSKALENMDKKYCNFRRQCYNISYCTDHWDTYWSYRNSTFRCISDTYGSILFELTAKVNKDIFGFSYIVGEELLPKNPQGSLIEGDFNNVDIMIGHTQDEGSHFLAKSDLETFGAYGQKDPQVNKTMGEKYIRNVFKDSEFVDSVVEHYLGSLNEDEYDKIREQTYHAIGDYLINCPNLFFAESYGNKGNNVFAYYFNHVPYVNPKERLQTKPPTGYLSAQYRSESMRYWAPWMGSGHYTEVPFVYGSYLGEFVTAAEKDLSRRLMKIWINFAKTGDPGESWPKFSRSDPYFQEFNISNRTSYLEQQKKNCDIYRRTFGFL